MKAIIITGVTKGIGRAIAERFHESGEYLVYGCSRNSKDLKEMEAKLPRFTGLKCDVGVRQDVIDFGEAILEEIEKASAIPDILVNNAGVFLPGSIAEEEIGFFETQINVNLASAYHLTRTILPKMKAQKDGMIVNMCSTASIVAYPDGGSYCISKFALYGFSKVLREELKKDNIRVTSILPGAVFTDSWKHSTVPKECFMDSQSIAETVWFARHLPHSAVAEDLILRPIMGDF